MEFIYLPQYDLKVTIEGYVISTITNKPLKPCKASGGYVRIYQTLSNGLRKNLGVHRLVAIAFIPNPEGKPDVNHIDGNKENNHVSNLEWVTESENTQHSLRNLENKPGRPVKMEERDNEIRAWFKNGITRKELAEHFGISRPRIGNIINGKRR